jgi:hypothetical protein
MAKKARPVRGVRFIDCRACGDVRGVGFKIMAGEWGACPVCGSTERDWARRADGTIRGRSALKDQRRVTPKKRPILESENGDSFYRDAQRWDAVERTYDRDLYIYTEDFTDPLTGRVDARAELLPLHWRKSV